MDRNLDRGASLSLDEGDCLPNALRGTLKGPAVPGIGRAAAAVTRGILPCGPDYSWRMSGMVDSAGPWELE